MRAAYPLALTIYLMGCAGSAAESSTPSPVLIARGNFTTGVGEAIDLQATRNGSSVTGRMTVSARGQNEAYAYDVDLKCTMESHDGLVMIGGVTVDSTGQEAPPEGTWAGIVLERGSPVGASTWHPGARVAGGSCLGFLDEQDMLERRTHLESRDWTDPIEGAVELGP